VAVLYRPMPVVVEKGGLTILVDTRTRREDNLLPAQERRMKQRSGPRKTASTLSESIHQQLRVYALATVLAVVSVLALTGSSAAKIVYTPTQVHIAPFQRYQLDLDHDDIPDFAISVGIKPNKCSGYDQWLWETPASRSGAEADTVGALALAKGARIGKGGSFQGSAALMASSIWVRDVVCLHYNAGHWPNVSNRYLGPQFKIHGKTHYGWARLDVYRDATGRLTGYAYETIPGKSLKAGQRKETADEPTNEDLGAGASVTRPTPNSPPPTTQGALAMGAPGLLIWRRDESVGPLP
jgi:hypothetical protein